MTIAVASGVALLAAPSAAPASLTTPYVSQNQSNWCWAACFEMIRNCLNLPPRRQCEIVTRKTGIDCCALPIGMAGPNDPGNPKCYPDDTADTAGLSLLVRDRVLQPQEIHDQIAGQQSPVEVSMQFTMAGVADHVLLIVGVAADGSLHICDPWPAFGESTVDYSHLCNGYHQGTWNKTYISFADSGG